jgi:Tfp pilus assembly protein PilF
MRVITRRNLEAALAAIEERLHTASDSLDLRADRARLLSELGQVDEAKRQYLEILKRDHTHCGTLVNFADLLLQTGFSSAAKIAYRAAITYHPGNPRAHSNFADLLMGEGMLEPAREHYDAALLIDAQHVNAHRGLAAVFWELGDGERAQHHLSLQFRNNPTATFPYLGTGEPIPLLVLMSATRGNLPWHDLIDNRIFLIITIAVEFYDRSKPLPPHRLVFNSIGDADICQPALEAAAALLAQTTVPVINSPAAVMATGRTSNSERLGNLPGVVAPRIFRMPRAVLTEPEGVAALASRGLSFPLLLRRPGFHTGQHFVCAETPADLPAAAASLPGDDVLVIEYLNARGVDGKARKYRVMSIGGRLYPLHLAVSEQWKVHYFSAEMAGNPQHQAEESAFLSDMPRVLGSKAMRALEEIRDALGLDYGGIDFGLDPRGDVLLFEANATMLIRPPGPGAQWDYRRAPIGRALVAARALVFERAEVRAVAHA